MNVDHVKLFVRLASTHNISSAGRELNLSPAVASAYINKLEESLGVRLVHRTTRKASLTEEGEAFLPHAEDVLSSIEVARASVGSGEISPRGTLRVTAPASFGRMHMLPQLRRFLDTYPDLHVDLRLSDTIVDLVDGGYDIAIRNAKLADSSLIARRLATDNRIVCASPDYLKEFGTPQTPDELVNHHCVCLSGVENWTFGTGSQSLTIHAQGRFRVDNGEAVRDACVDGIGVAIASNWSVYKHIKSGELIRILPEYPLLSSTAIWAVYPSSRLLAPKVRAFIDFFSDAFGDKPYWD